MQKSIASAFLRRFFKMQTYLRRYFEMQTYASRIPFTSNSLEQKRVFSQTYKPEMPDPTNMDIATIAFYVILFVLAFMIARIIMKIMRGY